MPLRQKEGISTGQTSLRQQNFRYGRERTFPCKKRKAIIPVRILFVQGLSFPASTAAPHGSGPPSHRLGKIREQKSRKPLHELFPIHAKHISVKNRMENVFHPVFFRIVRPDPGLRVRRPESDGLRHRNRNIPSCIRSFRPYRCSSRKTFHRHRASRPTASRFCNTIP